ncbi:phage tail tape measure protein [Pediococcus stilesii]|uniref:Uncharacterized protein n=1 Tax=Pediococcus stilesii TaxID=331679 RepID=A0A0R2L550_9LACO|nr:phage tail tape measure protein [Pediococcus stilesii]KRN94588.1 hypothetical protein IV81_GL001225 [Pediococcus stilesii]
MSSVINDIDYKMLSEIMKATAEDVQEKTQKTESGMSVTPGQLGVNPGGQPVMSLFDLARQK